MTTSAKPAKKTPAKAVAKAAAKPVAKPEAKPFLRFHHTVALREKTTRLLATLEASDDATAHGKALADLVIELTSAGMDAYFLEPLKRSKAGFIVQQSANLGLVASVQVMGKVIRNIIERMDDDQLRSVCGSIRQFAA